MLAAARPECGARRTHAGAEGEAGPAEVGDDVPGFSGSDEPLCDEHEERSADAEEQGRLGPHIRSDHLWGR